MGQDFVEMFGSQVGLGQSKLKSPLRRGFSFSGITELIVIFSVGSVAGCLVVACFG